MAAVGGDHAEAQLTMSLDELIEKNKDAEYGESGSKRVARRQHRGNEGRGRGHQGRGMGQRWNGAQNRGHGHGGPMQQQQQQQFHQQQQPHGPRMQQQQQLPHGHGPYNNGWQQHPQHMQPQMGFQQPYGPQHHMQQQHHGRGSVFERLGGPGRAGGGRGGPAGRGGPLAAAPPVPHYKVVVAQDPDTGDVTVAFRDVTIIQVRPSGEVVLDTCATRTKAMLGALNQALNKINLRVTALPTPAAAAGVAPREVVWNVSDGRSLQRFEDGMVVPAKGTATAARGRLLLRAHGLQPVALTAAAQEASTQAARAAGLLGEGDAAMVEGDAGAEAGGGEGAGADPMEGDFEEYGAEDAEAANIRRLKAQGRFNPY